ncbi:MULTISPECIES: hypothetical protein [Mesorhizobium]|uniref:Uncharacterized protein n=1 Tax=Mesorhizobium denitrificans TaxID=2294114 RepID=A0A371XG06_9HYPH|nr:MULTISPECIES: hypothetical protein [Mesorhizobium]RFC68159.1 hypothetical protein DY251_07745 [Mesorhizobium denitrificans]
MDVKLKALDGTDKVFIDRITLSNPKRLRDVAIGICKMASFDELATPDGILRVEFTGKRVTGFGSIDGKRLHVLSPFAI